MWYKRTDLQNTPAQPGPVTILTEGAGQRRIRFLGSLKRDRNIANDEEILGEIVWDEEHPPYRGGLSRPLGYWYGTQHSMQVPRIRYDKR